jgi:hypothetical protein
MSKSPERAVHEAELYLHMLTLHAPAHALLDVRYRIAGPTLGRLFLGTEVRHAARLLVRIARERDVYLGVAPRMRRRGTRQDLAPTSLLWADCDGPQALTTLQAFRPQPSMLIASGSPAHAHAYWPLSEPLPLQELEQANRALASALGADSKCADAARILRPPGTRNFKYTPPRLVHVLHYNEERHEPAEILADLPVLEHRPAAEVRQANQSCDPLLSIPPARYVEVLLGQQVPRSRKLHCPFHADGTPSLHVYPTPEQGWTCFGCTNDDGRPLGGDIYTLASRLWQIPTCGQKFLELRERLDALFEITRA